METTSSYIRCMTDQEAAALQIQAIQRGNAARAETEQKKGLNGSKIWAAVRSGDVKALRELLLTAGREMSLEDPNEGTPLKAAIVGSKYECAKALVAYDGALGLPEAQLAVWQRVQQDQLPIPEGEEGEEKDVNSEEYQADLASTMLSHMAAVDAGFLVKAIIKIGLYVGERAVVEEHFKQFDTQLGDKLGYGVCLSPAGDVYAGMYGASGRRNGQGALRTKAGTAYVGEWKEGKRHGKGSMTYADGGVYTGSWSYGKRHGQGTFRYASGDEYSGLWHAGDKHGAGKVGAAWCFFWLFFCFPLF